MILQSIWFYVWGLLWAVFFITDGYDFGVGSLYPFLGKSDQDKRVMINSLGPLWDGNEVWADHRRRRHICRLSSGLCGDVFLALLGADADFVCPYPERGIF